MARFVQYLVTGLSGGSVVALLGMSVVMIYRSTRVLSFAQGAIASLSTYVYYQLSTVWHVPVALGIPLALIAAAAIGIVANALAIRPLRRADNLTRTVATLGLVLVILVIVRVGWGGGETFVQPLTRARVTIGTFDVGVQDLIIAGVALAAAVVLVVWTRRTYTGLGLSAIAEDQPAARLLGVSLERSSAITWAVSSVVAALAGILVTPLLVLNPFQMTLIMVTSFGAALLGGFVSLPLTLLGGALIGSGESLITGYSSVSGLPETFGFLAVVLVLLVTRGRRGNAPLLTQRGEAW